MTHLWSWLTAVIAISSAAPVAAQPTVLVRAETRIELRTERMPNRLVLLGALRDDLGFTLAGQAIHLRLDSMAPRRTLLRRTVQTDPDGAFRVEVEVGRGDHELRATYNGDRGHERAQVSRSVDLDRADVRLRVAVPNGGHLDLDQDLQEIEVQAISLLNVDGITIELVDELDRPLAAGSSNAEGRVRFEVASRDLGEPGAGRIKAMSQADGTRARAQTEVPVVRFRATELSLDSATGAVELGEPVVLTGDLGDSQGPLGDRAIGLFARADSGDDLREEHLATVLTDADGTYRAEVRLEGHGGPDNAAGGPVRLIARFESETLGREGSESAPLTVAVGGTGRGTWLWAALPLTISLFALAIIARRAPRRLTVIPPPAAPAPKGIAPSLRSSRRPADPAIAGRVVDRTRKSPIRGALVTLGELRASTGEDGAFRVDGVPPGEHLLRVSARGYSAEETIVSSPHRGEWSAITVRLESLREQILAPYRRIALALIPSSRLWEVWTNREVLAHDQEGPDQQAKTGGTGDLEHLTAKVDEGFYSKQGPSEADVLEVRAGAEERRREGSTRGRS